MFSERIKALLEHYQLTSAELADRLEVQRSGISHLLAGRNNPRIDFLVKLLDHFDDLSPDWLLSGKGEITRQEKEVIEIEVPVPVEQAKEPDTKDLFSTSISSPNVEEEEPIEYRSEISNEPPTATRESAKGLKKPVRMMLIYDDGTFEEFRYSE